MALQDHSPGSDVERGFRPRALKAPGRLTILRTPPVHTLAGPAVFLDRDGVINERIVDGYVTEWESFTFTPGVISALTALSQLGLPMIVVSNQAGVGKGLMSVGALEDITRRFLDVLHRAQARIDAVYYCMHVPADGCGCRKPMPGLLEDAANDWKVDLNRSVVVGDSPTDAAAAAAAGCKALILSPVDPEATGAAAERALRVASPSDIFGGVVRLLASR